MKTITSNSAVGALILTILCVTAWAQPFTAIEWVVETADTAAPQSCGTFVACPADQFCFDSVCRSTCETHADCTAPDKCFMNGVFARVCLHEGEYRCSYDSHTACQFVDNPEEMVEGAYCWATPCCLASAYTTEQHESHGDQYYCGQTHNGIATCTLNATNTGCEIAGAERECWATCYE